MIFVLQIENMLSDGELVDFLVAQFKLTGKDINKLHEANTDAKINYEIRCRDYPSEFKIELLLFIRDESCIELEIYNSLQITLRFVDFFSRKVVIKDESNDPFRWILITNEKKLFIVDEIIEDGEGLFIDYSTMKEITIARAMSVMPDRNYYFLKQEERPVFFNQDSNWG